MHSYTMLLLKLFDKPYLPIAEAQLIGDKNIMNPYKLSSIIPNRIALKNICTSDLIKQRNIS